LAALLQSAHCVHQIGHRSADRTIPQVAAHRATAYHHGGLPSDDLSLLLYSGHTDGLMTA
jgi:hypothetical protein